MATYNPDADPETTSVYGYVRRQGVQESWSTIHDHTDANETLPSAATPLVHISTVSSSGASNFTALARIICLFDISAESSEVIASAKFRWRCRSKTNTFGLSPSLNIFYSLPASNTDLVNGDYDSITATPLSTAIAHADIDPAGWNEWILNAAGLVVVNTALAGDGIVNLAIREATYDAPNSAPTWADEKNMAYNSAGAADFELVITYLPLVTTQLVTNKVTTTATGNGNITNLGDPTATQHGHCWNVTGLPTITEPLVHVATGGRTENGVPSATGAFTSSLTELVEKEIYFIRAYATNSDGTSYGEQVTFVGGTPGGSDLAGIIRVVEGRLHYVNAYGVEIWLKGTPVE